MISDAQFAAMKPTAVIINVGRGPVIDEAAMVRALTAKRIKGAGLDVFEQEPLPPGDPMYQLENVLLSPHCADHTAQWLNHAMRFFLEQDRRFANGEPLENVVTRHWATRNGREGQGKKARAAQRSMVWRTGRTGRSCRLSGALRQLRHYP